MSRFVFGRSLKAALRSMFFLTLIGAGLRAQTFDLAEFQPDRPEEVSLGYQGSITDGVERFSVGYNRRFRTESALDGRSPRNVTDTISVSGIGIIGTTTQYLDANGATLGESNRDSDGVIDTRSFQPGLVRLPRAIAVGQTVTSSITLTGTNPIAYTGTATLTVTVEGIEARTVAQFGAVETLRVRSVYLEEITVGSARSTDRTETVDWLVRGVGMVAQQVNDTTTDATGTTTLTLQLDFSGGGAGTLRARKIVQTPIEPVVFLSDFYAGNAGGRATFTARVGDGYPYPAFQWYRNDAAIPGATGYQLVVPSVQPADVGLYYVVATNAAGSTRSATLPVYINGGPPLIYNPTPDLTVPAPPDQTYSSFVSLTADVASSTAVQRQWLKDGVPLPGEDLQILIVPLQAARSGRYVLRATNSAGTVDSRPITLSIRPIDVGPDRLVNVSTRGVAGTGSRALIGGFVLRGADTKLMLLRGMGPLLAQYGIASPLKHPRIQLYRGNELIASNTGWYSAYADSRISQLSVDASRMAGAFNNWTVPDDAMLTVALPEGNYTVLVTNSTAGSGDPDAVALFEAYDIGTRNSRLSNLSTRGFVATDASVMIGGLAVNGPAKRRVLVRGVGPSLRQFLGNEALADAVLTVNRDGAVVATNDDWATDANAAAIRTAATQVGAFALEEGGRDAAMILTLDPGNYTFSVSGKNGATGIGLVEVYELPQP